MKDNIFKDLISSKHNTTIIIAEIGSSHSGNEEKAFNLIDEAAASGADCIKTQIIFADEIIPKNAGEIEVMGKRTSLYNYFKMLEKDFAFYKKLNDYCIKKQKIFLASAFGIKSLGVLNKLNVQAVKIASPELNHFPLLKAAKKLNKPMILSTGVSKLEDIKNALKITGKNSILLHCSTAYPTPEEDYNLMIIQTLRNFFKVKVGLSDHSLDPVLVPCLSLGVNTCIIEKHFCLDNKDNGIDDAVALNPQMFKRMTESIRDLQYSSLKEIIVYLSRTYDTAKILKIIGDGIKKLSASEENNYSRTNRSIHAVCMIKKGEKFTNKNIAILRTEKVLTPGLPPELFAKIIGHFALNNISDGEGIQFKDVFKN